MKYSSERIARIVSILFHPLLMPSWVWMLYFFPGSVFAMEISIAARLSSFILVFIMTFLAPVILILLLIKLKWVDDVYIQNHRQRVLPLFISALLYGMCHRMFSESQMPIILVRILQASVVTIVFAGGVSVFWKISLHAIAAGALTAAMFFWPGDISYKGILLLIVFIIGMLICWGRLKTKAHHVFQVIAGYIAGMLIVFCMLWFS